MGSALRSNTLDIPEPAEVKDVKLPYVIVGDAAFPLTVNMMRPYPGQNLPDDESNFNKRLSRARRLSENVFARLTNRFQLYYRMVMMDPKHFRSAIQATVVLHNFLESFRLPTDQYDDLAPPAWTVRVQTPALQSIINN